MLKTFTIISALAALIPFGSSFAWQITSVTSIPAGLTALGSNDEEIWCGYTEEDALIRVFDPEDERVNLELQPPEDECFGITSNGEDYWFMGQEVIYSIDADGEVQGRLNRPYEDMHGIVRVGDGFWTTVLLGGVINLAYIDDDGEEISRFQSNMASLGDLTWDGEHLWITDPLEGVIYEVDPETERTLEVFPSPAGDPMGITWFADHIYLVDEGDDEDDFLIYRINPEAEPAPRILPGARLHDFGTIGVHSPRQWYLSVFNIGSEELIVHSTDLIRRNQGFIVARPPEAGWHIAPGNFVSIRIIFDPDAYGNFIDTLLIGSDDPMDSLAQVVIKGSGILPFGSLLTSPDSLDFGEVRADPARDGSRLRQLHLINEGVEPIFVDSLIYGIPSIFNLDPPNLPYRLTAADTLTLDFWFTPHRGITYLDTLLIISRETADIAHYVNIRGRGNDSIFAEGTVLWEHELEGGPAGFGATTRLGDINGDGIGDIVAVGPSGVVYCLNGFGSSEVDILWENEFRNRGYRPEQVNPVGGIAADRDLDGDGLPDVLIASGGQDRAIYTLSGYDGSLVWRWDAISENRFGFPMRLIARNDFNGDGVVDPATIITDTVNNISTLVLLDGATGQPEWSRNMDATELLELIPDRDRNGVPEFVTVTGQNILMLFNGSTGRSMERINLGGNSLVTRLITTEDLDDDGLDDILFSTETGGILAYSISREEDIWYFDYGIGGPGGDYGPLSVMHREEPGLVFGTVSGFIGIINPDDDGSVVWAIDEVGIANATAFIPDINDDDEADLIIGYLSGLIECRDGINGEFIWAFPGDELEVGAIEHLEIIDDVDLGGTPEILSLSSDGVVRCISSHGDLRIGSLNEANILPESGWMQLSPNPFNSSTTITFELMQTAQVNFIILDNLGRSILKRELGHHSSGINNFPLNSIIDITFPSGLYYFIIETNSETLISRAVYLR